MKPLFDVIDDLVGRLGPLTDGPETEYIPPHLEFSLPPLLPRTIEGCERFFMGRRTTQLLGQMIRSGEITPISRWKGGAISADEREKASDPRESEWEDLALNESDESKFVDRMIGSYARPAPLPEGLKPDTGSDDDELRADLEQARARIAELERERAALLTKIDATTKAAEATAINSPTLQRIIEAVGAYPAWRAEWKSKTPPNLSHVEDWQKEVQDGARGGARLAYVAHIVIDEHFGLKT